jgi:hypothetical protein
MFKFLCTSCAHIYLTCQLRPNMHMYAVILLRVGELVYLKRKSLQSKEVHIDSPLVASLNTNAAGSHSPIFGHSIRVSQSGRASAPLLRAFVPRQSSASFPNQEHLLKRANAEINKKSNLCLCPHFSPSPSDCSNRRVSIANRSDKGKKLKIAQILQHRCCGGKGREGSTRRDES